MRHTIRFTLNSRRLVVRTLALLQLGLTGLAIAKPNKPPCHPNCGDPGEPPSTVSNMTQWGGLFLEDGSRPLCTTDGGSPTGTHGSYGCPVDDGRWGVEYDLQSGQPSKKKDDPTYCGEGSFVGLKYPDYRYVYAWEGPCAGDTCDASVYNTFYGAANHGISGVGLVHLVASGYITSSEEYPFDNPNPFAHPREIVIEEIDITFYALGNDRKLATCNYSGWGNNPPVLYTEPAEQ